MAIRLSLIALPLVIVVALLGACSDDTTPAPSTADGGSDSGGRGDGGGGGTGDGGGTGGKSNAAGCTEMCTSSNFDDGVETDLKNGLVECLCSGAGGEVTQGNCANYCSFFGIEKTLLGSESGSVKPDKCLCDGK